jgi:hypothetical protein
MKMSLQLEFSTTSYEFNHGRKPKGFGSWAFQEGHSTEIFAPYSMTLTNAKKWLKQHLIGQNVEGYFVVKVCP